ncbi:MAG: MBL fold metallo-hydrolase [Planctomycetota bacterium]|jgi:glyoxylase-like metal-dependent hydrolase (beta-lactamase superfamily II)
MAAQSLQIYVTNDPMFMENGYTIFSGPNQSCWIVDPGFPPQGIEILDQVEENQLRVEAIILTHAHSDHIGGVDQIRDKIGQVPVYLAEEEWAALTDPSENLSLMMGQPFQTRVTDPLPLAPGSDIEMAGESWQILDVAGHSPGGRALYSVEYRIVIVGDALFQGSIGRTDFHHSNHDQLMKNIRQNLFSLPDETRVLSGHGPETTIGDERSGNPFFSGMIAG